MTKERVVTWLAPWSLTAGIVLFAEGVDSENSWESLVLFFLGACLVDYWHRWLERSLGARHERKERCHGRP